MLLVTIPSCLVSLFQGHAACQNFNLIGPSPFVHDKRDLEQHEHLCPRRQKWQAGVDIFSLSAL